MPLAVITSAGDQLVEAFSSDDVAKSLLQTSPAASIAGQSALSRLRTFVFSTFTADATLGQGFTAWKSAADTTYLRACRLQIVLDSRVYIIMAHFPTWTSKVWRLNLGSHL